MHFSASLLFFGIACAIVSGIMNGIFTLPMRYLGQWPWENVWAIVMLVPCVLMPIAIVLLQRAGMYADPGCVASATQFYSRAFSDLHGVSEPSCLARVSLPSAFPWATRWRLPSAHPSARFFPSWCWRRSACFAPRVWPSLLGTLIGIVGIACFGYAGFRREKSQQGNTQQVRGDMVGHARPFAIGLLLCIGSGLLSAVFNIGYSLGQPIRETAVAWDTLPSPEPI